jgi:hypothetical protein
MPAERKNIGKPRRTGNVISAAHAPAARGSRIANGNERNRRAALELMREIGYAHPDAIAEFQNLL